MSEKVTVALPYDDYAQSANTLFHFRGKSDSSGFIVLPFKKLTLVSLIIVLFISIITPYFSVVIIVSEMVLKCR